MRVLAGAGLAVLALLAGCDVVNRSPRPPVEPPAGAAPRLFGIDWPAAVRVDVVLDEYAFAPATLVFRRGEPYRLHLENRGRGRHNFDAPDFFRAVTLREDDGVGEVIATGGKVVLAPGKAVDLYFVAAESGRFPFECSRPLHPLFGMTGEIVIE